MNEAANPIKGTTNMNESESSVKMMKGGGK